MRSVHTEASAHDQGGRFRLSAPCVALAGTAGAVCASILSFTHPPSCPPSLGTALLSVLLAAHRRCSTMRALTPARRSHARQVSSLTPLCLPDIPTPTTSCASNVAFAVTSARPARPVAKSRLRQRSQARQHTPPKRVRHPTGYPFASGYFPPRLAATQLPSASCNVTSHGQDLHLTDKAYSRTYEGARPRAP